MQFVEADILQIGRPDARAQLIAVNQIKAKLVLKLFGKIIELKDWPKKSMIGGRPVYIIYQTVIHICNLAAKGHYFFCN